MPNSYPSPFLKNRIHKPSIPKGIWNLALLPSFRIRHTHGQTLPSHGFAGDLEAPARDGGATGARDADAFTPFPWILHRPSLRLRIARKEGKEREGRQREIRDLDEEMIEKIWDDR